MPASDSTMTDVEDVLPRRHDAFRQAEADGEILEIGRRRQHHRMADAVVLEGDRRLLGQVVGPGCSIAPYMATDYWLHAPTSRDTCTAVTLYSGQLVAQSELSVVITLAPDSGKWKVV
jgi:hydroxyethylthiazole kinase-like sugar kinase family protein